MEAIVMSILCDICGAEEGELESGLDLFDAGLLDSFGIVRLLVELEERLGVSLDIEQLSREEISTPARIIQLVGAAL